MELKHYLMMACVALVFYVFILAAFRGMRYDDYAIHFKTNYKENGEETWRDK